MLEAFHLGGWGMYPTTIFGLVLVATALRHPTQRIALVRALSVLTALSGALGFVSGVIKSFTSVAGLDAREAPIAALVGVGESLCNIGLALGMLLAAWLAIAVARARGDRAELTAV